MYLTLYISSNCKSPIIYDFEFFLRVRTRRTPRRSPGSQTQVFVVFAVKDCRDPGRDQYVNVPGVRNFLDFCSNFNIIPNQKKLRASCISNTL